MRDSGAQKSGALTSRPRNPSGITPMISNGAPLTSTVRPSTFGSRIEVAMPSLVAQHEHGIAAGAIVIGEVERPADDRVDRHRRGRNCPTRG